MELSAEITLTAQQLGQILGQAPAIQAYRLAVQAFAADPEALALEQRLYKSYESLLARQQAGEALSQAEILAFNRLRAEVQSHPLILRRETALREAKAYLAQVADEISLVLQVDYTALVKEP